MTKWPCVRAVAVRFRSFVPILLAALAHTSCDLPSRTMSLSFSCAKQSCLSPCRLITCRKRRSPSRSLERPSRSSLPAALACSVRQKDRIHCFSTVGSVCSPFQFALSKEIRSGPCCPAWVCTTRWRHNVSEDDDDLIHNVFPEFFLRHMRRLRRPTSRNQVAWGSWRFLSARYGRTTGSVALSQCAENFA